MLQFKLQTKSIYFDSKATYKIVFPFYLGQYNLIFIVQLVNNYEPTRRKIFLKGFLQKS